MNVSFLKVNQMENSNLVFKNVVRVQKAHTCVYMFVFACGKRRLQ